MSCVHHWLVESPEKGKKILAAQCKRCGESKTFASVIDDTADRWARLADGGKAEPVLVAY
jgi:uncharacterized OB-fold protein